jgi:hypothetical protein
MDEEMASGSPRVLAGEILERAVGALDQALDDPAVELAHDVRIGQRGRGPGARAEHDLGSVALTEDLRFEALPDHGVGHPADTVASGDA